MTKEEFLEKSGAIEEKISALKAELAKVGEEYIATNQPYPIGTKVKITVPKQYSDGNNVLYGFVKGYRLCYDTVRPYFSKPTKEGTPSKIAEIHLEWWKHPVLEAVKE